jgi:signal transduction histidine kinase
MLLAVGTVTGLAWWDSRRESEAILRDVGREQSVVASVLAMDLRAHLETVERDATLAAEHGSSWGEGRYGKADLRQPGRPRALDVERGSLVLTVSRSDGHVIDFTVRASDLLGETAFINSGELQFFVAPPGETLLYSSDGHVLSLPALRNALDRHQVTAELNRSEAFSAGLLPRTAMAGLAHVDVGSLGQWGVAAVATAARQRDREARAFWRFLLGAGIASGLVLAFGGVALRNQRRELKAQHDLAVVEIERARDDQLSRAERVATMGTFAMGIVHEVATPLSVIMGRAEQLQLRSSQDDRSVHAAQAIIAQVERIQLVVRRFLDMARGAPPSLARTDPVAIIRASAATVLHRFVKARVALSVDDQEEMSEIRCDRALLEQALVNLLLNACDACTPGGHVEISTHSDTEQVAFVVTDDGVGIDPEIAARAKDPFFTTKPAGAGTGLGLAIASEIAKSHRGELTIAANDGRGTRACIEIPLAIRSEETAS